VIRNSQGALWSCGINSVCGVMGREIESLQGIWWLFKKVQLAKYGHLRGSVSFITKWHDNFLSSFGFVGNVVPT
jgi:hypothetical protein